MRWTATINGRFARCPEHGHVLKVLNAGRAGGRPAPVVIDDIRVFSDASPVTALRVVYTRHHGDRLVAMSRDQLSSLPLHRCTRSATCAYVRCCHAALACLPN